MIERLTAFLNGASFHRGLALGALVGAAIAGSTLWAKLRPARPAGPDVAEMPPVSAAEPGPDRSR